MGQVLVTIRVMPESPEIDLDPVLESAKKKFQEKEAKFLKSEVEPIAFGLKALVITVSVDENKGSPDPVAEALTEIEGVQSADITDVRRMIEF